MVKIPNPFKREREVEIKVDSERHMPKQVQTSSGLEVTVFGESLEVERRRGLLALDVQLARRGLDTPDGAEYRISVYKSLGDRKIILPGVIYVGPDGIIIKGVKIVSQSNEVFDYRAEL